MPAIPPHKTATTDAAWDGPAAKANLKNDGDEAYYRSAFAWQDADGDAKTKAAYKFIHHEVSSDGKVGAANLTGCSAGIGVLNGGRGGTTIPSGDRKGVYNHLAKHIRDGGKEPPELNSVYRKMEPESAGYLRIMGAIHSRPWVITAGELDCIIAIVQAPAADLEAVAARSGKPLDNHNGNRVENRGGTAVLNVEGPLFRYANVMTRVSGATSVQQLALDFQAAIDDPAIHQVLLNINSPGGQVDGINEMADRIRAGSRVKPVTAYVDGMAASGGYWLAAAANRIVANESSFLGSIGVIASITDNRGAQERQGVKRYEIISSQSPLKNQDPATEPGLRAIQAQVDTIAQLFIERMAMFRGVSVEKATSDFGMGALFPARQAIGAGMADALGGYEELLGDLGATARHRVIVPGAAPVDAIGAAAATPFDEDELEEQTDEANMNDESDCTCPPGTDEEDCTCGADKEDESEGSEQGEEEEEEEEVKTATSTEERQRIAAILNSEEARGREELARVLALETNHTPEEAKKILAASPVAAKPSALDRRMSELQNPKIGAGTGEEDTSVAAEVSRILKFVPKDRKVSAVQ